MTREFIEQLDVVEPNCFETNREEIWYKVGLVDGLNIADENPNLEKFWHDVSEIPSKAYPIMIEINDDIDPTYDVITVDGKDEKFWKFLASDRDITRWAYVSDLLPKGGEE